MQLRGKESYQATAQDIWNLLMDTTSLAVITPGLSKLEAISPNQFIATADVKIGPVKGSFKGELSLTEIEEFQSFVLNIMQKSKIGNANATVRINLTELGEGKTELSFDGKVKMSGLLARTGARVMSGVSKSMSNQFFENLNKELSKIKST